MDKLYHGYCEWIIHPIYRKPEKGKNQEDKKVEINYQKAWAIMIIIKIGQEDHAKDIGHVHG